MSNNQKMYREAKKLIPGGVQLLSKRPEQFLPDLWPTYYKKAKGCEVWDLDDNHYIDMSLMGIGACILGYADDDVNKAVINVIENGNMSTLNPPEEVELAKELIGIHPWAEMVRYTRTGGEAMAVAVRIARASTKKDIILFCGYHGWHDWYLSANLSANSALDGHLLPGLKPTGVPRSLRDTSYPFFYNNKQEFLDLIKKYENKIAGVVLEAVRNLNPEKTFFDTLRRETERLDIPLIVDEISSGFRMNCGGAHLILGLYPDIAVFAKGISNGYPMGIVIGKKKYMDAAQDSFISSTYWTERIGPTATLATIKKMKEKNVQEYIMKIGEKVQEIWISMAEKHGIEIKVSGIYPLSHFEFIQSPLILKTLFTQEMLEKGFLATTSFYPSYAHKTSHINKYIKAVDETFEFISLCVRKGEEQKFLKGPVCQSGFKRIS